MSGFSAAEVSALPDDKVVDSICEVVINSAALCDEPEVVAMLDASPEGFGIVYSLWLLDAEVKNGGFHQYFWNHGRLWEEWTRRGLRRIGAQRHLEVLEAALALSAHAKPKARGRSAKKTLKAFSAAAGASEYGSLDSQWYDLPELDPVLVAFVRANPELVWEDE